MNFSEKIVTTIPLDSIWTEHKEISSKRISYLSSNDIVVILKNSVVQFVVANLGDRLEWVDRKQNFQFWKKELKQHVSDNTDNIDLSEFADNYVYLASQWTEIEEIPIILLEKIH